MNAVAIEVFNRYEHKFMLNQKTYEKVIQVMDEHIELDQYSNGHIPYTISNIYYDTHDDYLIRTSLSRPQYREKLRLRAYGIPQKNLKVFLEIKKKVDGIVNKRRTKIELDTAYDFLSTGTMPPDKSYINQQVMREIEYFTKRYNLSPKLYLAYDRIAYFAKNNSDLRISFDMNIRSRRYDLKLESGDYGEKLLGDDVYLMEIKTSYAMPLWLSNMLSELKIRRCRFSKYGTEFKQYINNKSLTPIT